MLLRAYSPNALQKIDFEVENTPLGRRPVFCPEAMTRLAVRASKMESTRIRVMVILSTDPDNTIMDDGFTDVSRVAVCRTERSIHVLAMHELGLIHSPSSCQAVAQLASRIVTGTGGFTAETFRDQQFRNGITYLASIDGGATWLTRDVSRYLQEFSLDSSGVVTVRCENRAARMPISELCARLDCEVAVVDALNGFSIDPSVFGADITTSDQARLSPDFQTVEHGAR